MTSDRVFIGIEPTAGGRLHTLAVLDTKLRIVRLDKVPASEVIERVTAYSAVVCAIDAPIAPSRGLLADPAYRRRLGLDARASAYSQYRVCEYEMRRRKIALYNTPVQPEQAARWMLESWRLYDQLRQAGFVDYPQTGARRLLEAFPHGAFTAIIKKKPYSKTAIEGLLQRQLVLYEEGVDVRDPMGVLEEWTRHRILKGELNQEGLLPYDQLAALMAALTAYVAEKEPQRCVSVGDPAEGQIVLPVEKLQDSY